MLSFQVKVALPGMQKYHFKYIIDIKITTSWFYKKNIQKIESLSIGLTFYSRSYIPTTFNLNK